MSDVNDASPAEVWAGLRAEPRPVLAFLKHVTASADPDAELARLLDVLSDEEQTALLPEIQREKAARDAWFEAHRGVDDAS